MNDLEKYRNITDKYQSLFTILTYNTLLDDILGRLTNQLKIIQTIKSSYKRKYINDRLYKFICFLKETDLSDKNKFNYIFLIDDTIEYIKLSKKQINILNEYNIINYTFIFDDYFHIDYLIDLFTNFTFNDVIYLDKKIGKHYLINTNKKKIINQFSCSKESDITQYISKNTLNKCLIHGQNTILKKLTVNNILVFNKKLNNDEIINAFMDEQMKENHKQLKKCFDMLLDKDNHLVVYGKLDKEIKEAIENYKIKKLFVHIDVLSKLHQLISKEYFNFDVIEINSIDKNDIGKQLLVNYNGIIGISYY
jgi:hypothetical protein